MGEAAEVVKRVVNKAVDDVKKDPIGTVKGAMFKGPTQFNKRVSDEMKPKEQAGPGGEGEPEAPPETPTMNDNSVQEEARRARANAGRGRASTILTSNLGDTSKVSVSRRTLLGS